MIEHLRPNKIYFDHNTTQNGKYARFQRRFVNGFGPFLLGIVKILCNRSHSKPESTKNRETQNLNDLLQPHIPDDGKQKPSLNANTRYFKKKTNIEWRTKKQNTRRSPDEC